MHSIHVDFHTLIEDEPGALWQAQFERLWPAYRSWFLRSSVVERPSYLESRSALRKHMPELVPVWERLVELAGGGDIESRFLSLWCPPPYIAGCSQAVWLDRQGLQEPVLFRNYDFAPGLLEGSWLATRWLGQRRVIALGDCLWGALDGLNEAGLTACLSFGGRTVSGTGFGIPLVLRYVLEVAQNTEEGVRLLEQLPVSMCYTVTLLDASGHWATVFVAPDRPAEVTRRKAATNFQKKVEWAQHATATHAVERLQTLEAQIEGPGSAEAVAASLLQPPLYQSSWERGYGTLYSAAYRPRSRSVALFWPGQQWVQTVHDFAEGERRITYPRRQKPA